MDQRICKSHRKYRTAIQAAVFLMAVFLLFAVKAKAEEKTLRIAINASGEVFFDLKKNMGILEEIASVEILWNESEERGSTADSIIYFVQDAIEQGVDGILLCPPNDQVLSIICRMCGEAQVYWGIYFRSIANDNIRLICENSPYYIGNVYEDEEENAYALAETILEKGYRKIALLSEAKWDTTCMAREEGINRALEEYPDAEIVAEGRDFRSEEDVASMTESILEAYPEVDCIYLVGSTVRNGSKIILDTIRETRGGEGVGLATIDFSQSLTEDFESGILKAAYGVPQFSIDAYYMAVAMVNQLKGYPLSEHAESYRVPGILVDSAALAEEISDATENPDHLYFTEEEVERLLLKWNNPTLDAAVFQDLIDENL